MVTPLLNHLLPMPLRALERIGTYPILTPRLALGPDDALPPFMKAKRSAAYRARANLRRIQREALRAKQGHADRTRR